MAERSPWNCDKDDICILPSQNPTRPKFVEGIARRKTQ